MAYDSSLAAAMALVLFAGCLGTPSAPVSPAAAQLSQDDFRILLNDCLEGGGHTIYPRDPPKAFFGDAMLAPPEWQPADVRDDMDNPVVGQSMIPIVGAGSGYYHATAVCKEWTYQGITRADWVSGHVGIRVEPPPFDPQPVEREYLISTLPFAAAGIPETLRALGVPATYGTGTIDDTSGWTSVLDDALNGTYKSNIPMKDLGPAQDHVVRLWFTVPVDETHWRPVSLDMTTTGHPHHLAAKGGGTFTHQHIGEAPPQHDVFSDTTENTGGLGWKGFDRVITLGPQPDILLDHGFKHH